MNETGIPVKTDPKIAGLDNDHLIAARTIQIALKDVEGQYVKSSMAGQNKTKGNREAFFEFAAKNKSIQEKLEKLSDFAADEKGNAKIFTEKPRIPMDKELATIWTDPKYLPYRKAIGEFAGAYIQNVTTAERGINTVTKEPYWNSTFQRITNQANPRYKNDKYDDTAFYFFLRTLLYMEMNEIPEITTPETAGGLYRDWVFTENVKSAICNAQKNENGPKKIVVNLGAYHATRVASLLRNDGFITDTNFRYLNADDLKEKNVMAAINSKQNDENKIADLPGYKNNCNGYAPVQILNVAAPAGSTDTPAKR